MSSPYPAAWHAQPRDILLVEDNPGDVALTRAAIEEAKVANPLVVAKDGEEALAILRGEGQWAGRELPAFILLDLNLPRIDGREVLSVIKRDPKLMHIPVVVLTSSTAERDIIESYDLGVNAYVTKPVEMDEFFRAVRSMGSFWFTVVTLPSAVEVS